MLAAAEDELSVAEPIPILNPDLKKQGICDYCDWFALDLLMELWLKNAGDPPRRYSPRSLSKTCPSCGATVLVDWETETVTYTPLGEPI